MTVQRWWVVLSATGVALVLPLLLVDVPPLLDYPNHLARGYLLAFGARDPFLSLVYAPRWAIIPNLATDIILPPLLRVLPIYVAGRMAIAVAVLLPVLGTIAYSRAVFGVRSYWPLASSIVAYNATLLLGFINFSIGLGLALLLGAAWIAWRDVHPVRATALVAIGTVGLFFCHLTGLLLCYLLIGAYEIECLWRRFQLRVLAVRGALLLPIIVLPAALHLASPFGRLPGAPVWPSLHGKLLHGFAPFANYWWPLDVVTAVVVVGAACVLTRWCRIRLCSGVAFVLLCVLFLVLPDAFAGTFDVDTRFAVMAAFLLFGGMLPVAVPRGTRVAVVVLLVGLFCARVTVLAVVWRGHQHELDAFRTVTASVAPGSRVLLAAVSPEQAPEYWQSAPRSRMLSTGVRLDTHLAALLLIEHHAFWPFLFDNPSQQPIETLPPYRDLALRADAMQDVRWLETAPATAFDGFDYLLLLDAGGMTDLAGFAPDRLDLLTASDTAALFRIRSR